MSDESLLDEKSFAELRRAAFRAIPPTRFNMWVTAVMGVLLVLQVALSSKGPAEHLEDARALSDVAISFGSQILGFLLGGFTIFVTVSKPEFFLFLSERLHAKAKVSFLKYNLFGFVRVLIVYLALLGIAVGIKILAMKGGIGYVLFHFIEQSFFAGQSWIQLVAAGTPLVFLGVVMTYSVLVLRSFIFNLYHVVGTIIEWEGLRKSGKLP